MATEIKTAPPELTSLYRVATIPLVASSIDTVHSTLSNNSLTKSPYSTATGIAYSAWGYTEPLQVRLAPLTTRADDIANKGLDVVESRYPYPFKAKPEEITNYVLECRASVFDTANKTLDDKVKSPAIGMAQEIDQRFAPIVDYFEVQVNKLNTDDHPASPKTEYQYQRALALSKSLTENLFVYSNEHLKELQAQNVLVQRATQTAHTISDLASSSLTTAQARIHTLADNMLQELQKLQASTAALPQSLQSSFPDLSALIADFRDIVIAKDITLNEKAIRVGQEVKEHVSPILEDVMQKVKELVGIAVNKGEATGRANGYAS